MEPNTKHVFESVLGVPFTQGNTIKVLQNGDEIFTSMLDAIDNAQTTIDFLTFVYWSGDIAKKFADALSEKSKQGITVRVLLDSFGARSISDELIKKMQASGIDVRWFRPLSTWRFWTVDNRTHRKVLLVDKRLGYTGGVGIAEEWEGNARNANEWRDTHFLIEGPAVYGLQGAFSSNWSETERARLDKNIDLNCEPPTVAEGNASIQIIRATASIGWSDIATVIELLLGCATKRIRIASAYFVPDQRIIDCFAHAVKRGVTVDVMFPGKHTDQRVSQIAGQTTFRSLMEAGVTLWVYQHTMLHTKIILVDDYISCAGSANFNQRSMRKDDEVVMTILDHHCAAELNTAYENDLRHCEKIRLEDWKNRNLSHRLLEHLTKPFRSQM